MGGPGSGRFRYRERVEDYPVLNLFLLQREGLFDKGSCGTVRWNNGVSISVWHNDGTVAYSFKVTRPGKEPETVTRALHLEYVKAGFGGRRAYFTCPGCGERRFKLLFADLEFRCRHCLKLVYLTQSVDELGRLCHRRQKLASKLSTGKFRAATRNKLSDEYFGACKQIFRLQGARADRVLKQVSRRTHTRE